MSEDDVLEIVDPVDWEKSPVLQDQGIFLQSALQKRLCESLGQSTWLFRHAGVRALVTKVQARRGTFFFLPYGPLLVDDLEKTSLKSFFQALCSKAKEEGAAFIRVSPFWEETDAHRSLFRSLGFRQAPIHMLAETLWLLDLKGRSEETILMGMEKKHRNLIRRAEKEGVEIKKSTDSSAVERFLDLHWQTMERHQFTPYPKDYFRKQVEIFAERDQILVFEASHQGELLASAIIVYYGSTAAYHHGASSSNPAHRKIPSSYLLQWEAIREALRRSCSVYNFWGIAPDNNPRHPFFGITHFKTGFGGRRFDLLPCQDLVISWKYYLNWCVEKIRKWRRGF